MFQEFRRFPSEGADSNGEGFKADEAGEKNREEVELERSQTQSSEGWFWSKILKKRRERAQERERQKKEKEREKEVSKKIKLMYDTKNPQERDRYFEEIVSLGEKKEYQKYVKEALKWIIEIIPTYSLQATRKILEMNPDLKDLDFILKRVRPVGSDFLISREEAEQIIREARQLREEILRKEEKKEN